VSNIQASQYTNISSSML